MSPLLLTGLACLTTDSILRHGADRQVPATTAMSDKVNPLPYYSKPAALRRPHLPCVAAVPTLSRTSDYRYSTSDRVPLAYKGPENRSDLAVHSV